MITFFSGSELDKYLLTNLFKKGEKRKTDQSISEQRVDIDPVEERKTAKLRIPFKGWLPCWRLSKSQRVYKGLDRIGKETDFVRFIKKAISIDCMTKILLTKVEQSIIKNSKKFVIYSG